MRVRKNQQRFLRLGISVLGVLTLSPALLGQASTGSEADPAIDDWSQHHVIFSRPATAEQAERLKKDFRYRQQVRRQSPAMPEIVTDGLLEPEWQFGSRVSRHQRPEGLWSEDMGSGATVGPTNYPAKYVFRGTTANCGSAAQPDFVVYGTGLTGASGQASIAAFDNLYSGCGGTVPSVYWAYNTFDGQVTTSPVFSSDGTQIAFVQTNAQGDGVLVLLKWAASSGTITGPISLTRKRNSDYPACIAPCMTTALLRDASGATLNADTNSSVFYDYNDDVAYVGDDAGWLHKFSPVFNGVPAEVTSAGWPVQVNPVTPTALTSPVYDSNSGRVFVADVGGFVYRVGPGTAFVATSSGPLDFSSSEGGSGFVQGPIVDSTSELLYVFSSSDGSTNCSSGAACTAVYQLPVDFPQGSTGFEAVVGASTVSGTAPSPLYLGAFDSTYENSTNATGNLYVCGNTGGAPALYQVHITAGVFGTVSAGPTLSSTTTPCSPVTDILNPNASGGATEWMFASAETEGIPSGCYPGGCIFNFKDTPWQASTAYAVGQEILDSFFQIQVVSVAGTSGAAAPAWQTQGKFTTDGTVEWVSQGVQSALTLAAWTHNHTYSLGSRILDPNGNIELATVGGKSGGTIPTFSLTPGGTTTDGTGATKITWTNVGAPATAAMAAAGGTSGIIVDNTVGSLAGASQVYFSTLSDQACGTSGTGGCAVQASQTALQ